MSDAMLKRVTIATVTYHSEDVISSFIASCPEGISEIIVVDNSNSTEMIDVLNDIKTHNIRLICNEFNVGFAAACNAAFDASQSEFVLICNPDTQISRSAVETMIAAADAVPDAGIVAPALLKNGKPVRSWDVDQIRRSLLPKRRVAENWPEGPFCADFVSGACMLFRREEKFRFDQRFFLYYEDDDICASVRRAGRSVILEPAAKISHVGGGSSTSSLALDRFKARHMSISRLIYIEKYNGSEAARSASQKQLARHVYKLVRHVACLQLQKSNRDWGGLIGTLEWIRGR